MGAVHGYVMDEDPNQDKRVVDSDKLDESDIPEELEDSDADSIIEEADRGKRAIFDEKADAKDIMDSIDVDIDKIKDAKDTQDDEDMEAALHSFYFNRNALKEIGVDEDIMKGLDDMVDAMLKTD